MIDVHDDLHLAVEFLNRAAVMRDELGVAAYRRAMHQALVALGDSVIAEAERLAGASARARGPSGTVVPFGRTSRAIRRRGDATDSDGSKRGGTRNQSRSPIGMMKNDHSGGSASRGSRTQTQTIPAIHGIAYNSSIAAIYI